MQTSIGERVFGHPYGYFFAPWGEFTPGPHGFAYTYRPRAGQRLTFMGVDHEEDNAPRIHEEWNDFMAETQGRDCVAIHEGRTPTTKVLDEENVMQYGYEGPLLILLAKKHNVPFISGEPLRKDEVAALLTMFPPELLMYYYVTRQLPQWQRMPSVTRPPIEQYAKYTFNCYRSHMRWSNRDYSQEWLAKQHEVLFDLPFDPHDAPFFLEHTANYATLTSPIKGIARACNLIRDIHLMHLYAKYKDLGKNIFDVHGWQHLKVLAPAIPYLTRAALQNPDTSDLGGRYIIEFYQYLKAIQQNSAVHLGNIATTLVTPAIQSR